MSIRSLQYMETLARNPQSIPFSRLVMQLLEKYDPDYPKEKSDLEQGIQSLKKKLPPKALPDLDRLLDAQKRRMDVNLAFLVWLGMDQCVDCYLNSGHRNFLKKDFEDIHQEDFMNTFQEAHSLDIRYDKLVGLFRGQGENPLAFLTSYDCYLETVAYKIAHYIGFRLASRILLRIIPGYTEETELISRYSQTLHDYFNE